MTDKEKFEQSGEASRPDNPEGHRFVKLGGGVGGGGAPHPDSPVIDLKGLRGWPEPVSTPGGPTMGDLREEFLRARFASGFTHDPTPPTATAAQIRDWWERINQIRREVNAAGLALEASIHHPGPEPWKKQGHVAELYGRPLAWEEEVIKATSRIKEGMEAAHKAMTPDYFGIEGPTLSEWLAQQGPGKVLKAHHQIRFHSSLSEQELLTMLEETKALSEVPIATDITPTQAMMKSLEAAGQKVLPYLLEDVFIPSCPVIGKQAPEAIDLSGEVI